MYILDLNLDSIDIGNDAKKIKLNSSSQSSEIDTLSKANLEPFTSSGNIPDGIQQVLSLQTNEDLLLIPRDWVEKTAEIILRQKNSYSPASQSLYYRCWW